MTYTDRPAKIVGTDQGVSTMEVKDLLLEVASLKDGGELDQVVQAARARQAALASLATAELLPGDTVRFSRKIRPKYLIGLTATVKRVNDASVTVQCPDDPSYGRFKGSRGVRCPNTLIEGRA